MGNQHMAGWALAAGVLLGVPVGVLVNEPLPVVAQSTAVQEAERLNQQVIQLYNQGRYSEAIPLAERSLAIYEKALGANHPDVALSLNNLAGLYDSQGQYAKAEPLYQRSLAIYEKALGANHPDVATSLNNLAALNWGQNQFDQALPRLIRGLDIEEFNLAQNLVIGSEDDKRAYLKTFSDTTNAAISFHLQGAPQNPQATRLALTTILRRKGRVLDVLGQSLNQQLSPADQERLARLSALRTQVAQIAFNPNATDQHDVQSGEGVYGLRRAFTLAGAQAQVMTLWRVDDNATKDLMVSYYQRLSQGEGRGDALRQAQLAMLKTPNYSHPKFWSGFIPAGDWRGMGR